jgi:hypothetical protein
VTRRVAVSGGLAVSVFDDMVAHMKTTVEIPEPLFLEVKRLAAETGTTLRELIEDGLRRVLEVRTQSAPAEFVLRDASVGGNGLQPGVRDGSWEDVRALIYEGRGG